jgi:cardiolipin synthase
VAFIGGMGVADHWLGHAQDKDHWRDTHFAVRGPAVRALEASFYENWIESGGRSAPALDPEPPPRNGATQSVVLWSNPISGASNVKLLYLLAIGAARKTIDIQSPYITLDDSTKWSLRQARSRGVRIRILGEGPITDAMPVKHASRYDYQDLLDQGVEIAEYQPTMMHTKAVVIDGVFSLIGSANFGNRSFELNDELTVGVFDRQLAGTLTGDFEADWRNSRQFNAATWPHARSFDGKLQEWFWSFFGEIF